MDVSGWDVFFILPAISKADGPRERVQEMAIEDDKTGEAAESVV